MVMKRKILCSSIILASCCSVPVYAFDAASGKMPGESLYSGTWEVQIGGFFDAFASLAASDTPAGTDYDGIDFDIDGEIQFKPSITLDNGLTLGIDIELEGTDEADQIDESYVYVTGDFGTVELGNTNSVGYKFHLGAPHHSNLGDGSPEVYSSLSMFIPFSEAGAGDDLFRGTLGTTFLENDGNNDATRVSYISPRFAGFQLGTSYARDAEQDDFGRSNCDTGVCNFFDIGANYVNSFGEFDVALSGRFGIANNGAAGASDPQVFGFGGTLSFGDGFTVGAAYADQSDADDSNGDSFELGIGYQPKDCLWGVSLSYFTGNNVDDEGTGQGDEEQLDMLLAEGSYQLAPGLRVSGFGAFVDFDEDVGGGGAGSGEDLDGFVIGTGLRLSF